jgi:hypothetical protein
MKKRNRHRQRQAQSQGPAPEGTAYSFSDNPAFGVAGRFHRKPLRPSEISRLGDVFKAGAATAGTAVGRDLTRSISMLLVGPPMRGPDPEVEVIF